MCQITSFFSIRSNENRHVGCLNGVKKRLLQLYLYTVFVMPFLNDLWVPFKFSKRM